jgi:hypothetical protein
VIATRIDIETLTRFAGFDDWRSPHAFGLAMARLETAHRAKTAAEIVNTVR